MEQLSLDSALVTHFYRFGCCGRGVDAHPTRPAVARHWHIADWHTNVVFRCVEGTLSEASAYRGRARMVRSDRATCRMRRKLES